MNRRIPALRRHKPSSRAVVTLNGTDHYLGPWPAGRKNPAPAVQAAYERLIAEWLASGRQLAHSPVRARVTLNTIPPSLAVSDEIIRTVAEVLAAYWDHAERYYRKPDGTPSPELGCILAAYRPLRKLYDDLPAEEFSPKKLKAVREHMIQSGLARTTINYHVGRIKRVFAWAVENELVPPSVFHGLQAVRGLKAGRSQAKESRPVGPVPPERVEKTLPALPPTVAAMVKLQMLTGMRSGEVCSLRPMDLDRCNDVWVYRPATHKTAHHGKERVVSIGPRAQAVLMPYLDGVGPGEFVFSPARTEADRQARRATDRKTPRWRSHMERNRRKRKADPKWRAGDRYTPTSYGRCVARACRRAFPLPAEMARRAVERDSGQTRNETDAEWRERLGEDAWRRVETWLAEHHWHPHQLRHLKGTEVRDQFDLDYAQVVLGHERPDMTQHYARVKLEKAAEVARLTG
jgi:integrase